MPCRRCATDACRCTPSALASEQPGHDVEIEDVSVAASAVANARMAATVSLTQHGYAGQKATLTVRDGDKLWLRATSRCSQMAAFKPSRCSSRWCGGREEP